MPYLNSTEADLLTRSGSVAAPTDKDPLTPSGKPLTIKIQKLIRVTCEAPPLKRERCTSKMEPGRIIFVTVPIRVKHCSKCSVFYLVHREDGGGQPPWATV